MATTDEGAFEALQRFAAAWHSKYAHVNGGENRKPPSLTMRADSGTAVLTEPQLRAVVAEYERMREELEATRIRLDLLALPVSADGLRALLAVAEQQPDAKLHARCAHPAYEYATTEGQRKAFYAIDEPPEGDGWERNVDAGRPGEGWDRFDYHEESYWRRLRAPVPAYPARGEGIGHA